MCLRHCLPAFIPLMPKSYCKSQALMHANLSPEAMCVLVLVASSNEAVIWNKEGMLCPSPTLAQIPTRRSLTRVCNLYRWFGRVHAWGGAPGGARRITVSAGS